MTDLLSLPQAGKYRVIYADPPWPFATWSHIGMSGDGEQKTRGQRSRQAPYETLSHKDIASIQVAELAAENAVLFLWVVQTQLPKALDLVQQWGFTFKSVAFAWFKGNSLPLFPDDAITTIGCGYWTRAGFEQCWLATKGKPSRLHADVRQTILEGRREHSRKPDCVYDRIERLVEGPYLELFARTTRPGWDSWGNELDKFAPTSAPTSAA